MKNNPLLALSILFLAFAGAFSVVLWKDVSLAPRIAFFAFGFGSGISAGQWIARRSN